MAIPSCFLIPCFLLSALVTLLAGITLAKTTDTLDHRFRIGEALGGMVLLGISSSLPEIAIVSSAARAGHLDVIIGTLLGGLAVQTLVIVLFDLAVKDKRPLSCIAGSPVLTLETAFAAGLALLAILAARIPADYSIGSLNPISPLLVLVWMAGIISIDRARRNPHWEEFDSISRPGRKHRERRAQEEHLFYARYSTLSVLGLFTLACLLTLGAGVVLEETGSALAASWGISSGLFAATALALVSSLPEISTGLESIAIGDNQLAISDIMGGNAFMLTLFCFADLIAQKPVLSFATRSDLLFTALGAAMMSVYAISFLLRPRRRYLKLGPDSWLVLLIYAAGLSALSCLR